MPLLISACVTPPASPMERHARMAAAAELAATRCGGTIGGYGAAKELKNDANKNLVTAKNLGATSDDLAKAKTDTTTAFETQAIWTSHQEACNNIVSQLAWASN